MCPRPVPDCGAESCAYGILDDVTARLGEVALSFDDSRRESAREEMAEAAVSLVEALSVTPVQALEAAGEIAPGGVQHEVVVRRHETEGVDCPAVGFDVGVEVREKCAPVVVILEDRAPVDSPRDDVEVAVRKRGAKDPWHETSTVGKRSPKRGPVDTFTHSWRTFPSPNVPETDMPRVRPWRLGARAVAGASDEARDQPRHDRLGDRDEPVREPRHGDLALSFLDRVDEPRCHVVRLDDESAQQPAS